MSNKPNSLKEKNQPLGYREDPIYRKPTWTPATMFTLNGNQMQALAELAGLFKPIVEMSDQLIKSAEVAGSVTTEFVYPDGTPVPEKDPRLEGFRTEAEAELEQIRTQLKAYEEKVAEAQAAMKEQAKKLGAKLPEDLEAEGAVEVPSES